MPIQIEVQDAHAQLLVDFYVQRLRTLKDEIAEKERESKDINAIIQKLRKKNVSDTPVNSFNGSVSPLYSEKWPWLKKAQFAIEHEGKPLTTKEIVDVLTEYEYDFIFDRKRVVASISSILSSKSGADKEFIRVESDSGDFAYELNKSETAQKDEPPVYQAAAINSTLDDDLPF